MIFQPLLRRALTAAAFSFALASAAPVPVQAQAPSPSQILTLWPRAASNFQLIAETRGDNAYSVAAPSGAVRMGDLQLGSCEATLQGFIGYELRVSSGTGLPLGAKVSKATLELRGGASPMQSGMLAGLGDLIVQREISQNGARVASLGAPPTGSARVSQPIVSNKVVDVTAMVQGFLQRGEASARFGLRFRNASNRNGRSDTLALCGGALRLTFTLPNPGARLVWSRSTSQFVGTQQIYTSREDSSDLRQVTSSVSESGNDERMPALSPDGTQVAFARFTDNDANYDIYSIGLDGTNLTRLTDTPEADLHPAWSPDGQKIAFMRRVGGAALHVMNADGTGVQQVAQIGEDSTPAWNPDGQTLAFASSGGQGGEAGLYLVQSDGSNLRLILPGYLSHPSWTPDGARLVVGFSGVLKSVASNGTDVRQLTQPGAFYDDWPSVAGDGHIVFHSNRTHGGEWLSLYKCNADGSAVTPLTDSNVSNFEPNVR